MACSNIPFGCSIKLAGCFDTGSSSLLLLIILGGCSLQQDWPGAYEGEQCRQEEQPNEATKDHCACEQLEEGADDMAASCLRAQGPPEVSRGIPAAPQLQSRALQTAHAPASCPRPCAGTCAARAESSRQPGPRPSPG